MENPENWWPNSGVSRLIASHVTGKYFFPCKNIAEVEHRVCVLRWEDIDELQMKRLLGASVLIHWGPDDSIIVAGTQLKTTCAGKRRKIEGGIIIFLFCSLSLTILFSSSLLSVTSSSVTAFLPHAAFERSWSPLWIKQMGFKCRSQQSNDNSHFKWFADKWTSPSRLFQR